MFHDMEEEVVRRRIEKARDERSNPKHRLQNAMELVELVARMVDSRSYEVEDPGPEIIRFDDPTSDDHIPAVQPENFEPAVDAEGNPVTADSLGLNSTEE